MKRSIITLLVFMTSLLGLSAQEEESLSLDSGNVDSQFEYVIKRSNNYQQYEVIPKEWMEQLKKQVSDTLSGMRAEKSALNKELNLRAQKIEDLTNQLANTRDSLDASRASQNEMALLGTPMAKNSYRVVMWSLVGLLLLLLIIFIIRFRRSNIVTVRARENLANLQDEFDQHRKRSLEREQKLRRELQDELNKQRRQ